MKTILIYDTETTGLPLFKEPSDHPDQPYITQLAAELCIEETGEVMGSMNVLIKPEGWTITDEITALTGITMEKAERFGFPIGDVLPYFIDMWSKANLHRVAHNESFDMRMIRIAMMRDMVFKHDADAWKQAPAFCTCINSTAIVNLPPTQKMIDIGKTTPKPPKLTEAYEFFFGKTLDGAHNAMIDVQGCKEVYYALRKTEEVAA